MVNLYLADSKKGPSYGTIADVGNMLICGTTGSGKSIYIHEIIKRLMETHTQKEVQFVLCDPKRVELIEYTHSPYVLIPLREKVEKKLEQLEDEINRRFELLKTHNAKSIYTLREKLPEIIFIHDEYLDDFDTNKDLEKMIIKVAKNANKVGVCMILAAQRPIGFTKNLMKYFKTKCCLMMATEADSKRYIGIKDGADLKGQGESIFEVAGKLDLFERQVKWEHR